MVFIKKRIIPYILIFTLVFGIVAKPIKAEASFALAGGALIGAEVAKTIGMCLLGTLVVAGVAVVIDEATDSLDDLYNSVGSSVLNRYNDLDNDTRSFVDTVWTNLRTNPLYYLVNPITITNAIFKGLFNAAKPIVESGEVTLDYSDYGQTAIPASILSEIGNSLENAQQVIFIDNSVANANIPYYVYILASEVAYVAMADDGSRVYLYDSEFKACTSPTTYYYYSVGASSSNWYSSTMSAYQISVNTMKGMAVDNPDYVGYSGCNVVNMEFITQQRTAEIPLDGVLGTVAPTIEDVTVMTSDISDVVTGTKAVEDVFTVTETTTGDITTDTTTDYTGTLTGIWDSVKAIPQTIIDGIIEGIKSIFIPSETALQEIQDKRDEKLPILIELQSWGNDVGYMLAHPEEYASNLNFVVDFGKSDTYWDYGGSTTNMISLDWYFDYKEDVDELLVGFAWLVFLWNLFGQAASLISGASSAAYLDTRNTHVINDRPKLPSRSSKRKGD